MHERVYIYEVQDNDTRCVPCYGIESITITVDVCLCTIRFAHFARMDLSDTESNTKDPQMGRVTCLIFMSCPSADIDIGKDQQEAQMQRKW